MPAKANSAPSAKIIAEARPIKVITDKTGREISYRQLSVLDQARLMRAVGSDNSNNEAFMGLAMMAAAVVDIDGVPCPAPRNIQQVDGAIDRIGDDGFAAFQAEMARLLEEQETDDAVDAAKN